MPTETLKIPRLSNEASEAFDRYLAAQEKQRGADATVRKQKKLKDEARDAVMDEMGEAMMAQLPDGRTIVRAKKEMERSAQKATTIEWWELSQVQQ